ncbi:MAG TPA: hypothetical protein VLB02_01635 [Candidatus Paceibacterota bacterium]|nr:hypothetical protein [Candidatus Paceibacterota bacterium]
MPDDGKLDHIAELQKKLYARDQSGLPERRIGILRPIKTSVQSTWGSGTPTIPKSKKKQILGSYRKFFLFSIIFLVLSMFVLGYAVLRGGNTLSAKNVDVTILGNSFIAGGESLPVAVEVANRNAVALLEAVLTIEYPKGSLDASGAEVIRIRKDLGTVPAGKAKSESFEAVLYGEQGTERTIKARLEYRLPNSNTPFVKEGTLAVSISSSPVNLTIDGPKTVPANQPVTFTIQTELIAEQANKDMILKIDYPTGFKYQSSSVAPISGNNVWSLAALTKGSPKAITIEGIAGGQSGEEKSFRVYTGAQDAENPTKFSVVYSSALHTIALESAFLEGHITLGDRVGSVVAVEKGTELSGYVQWNNNLEEQLVGPEIVLAISGVALDESSIRSTGGFYDSKRKAIVWNSGTTTNFESLAPGASGQFPFSFKTVDAAVGRRASDITLALSIRGRASESGFEDRVVDAIDKLTVRFIGSINFAASNSYKTGPIKNNGPVPPRADQTTTYTITWTVRPGDVAVQNAQATATLPFYVAWAGVVSPTNEAVTFEQESRTVRWRIGTIPQSVGVAQSRSASFQVSVTPSRSQVGSDLTLTNEGGVSGVDSVTSSLLQLSVPALTTRIDNLLLGEIADGVVAP